MNQLNQNYIRCSKQLEIHAKGIRDINVGIVYDKLTILSQERGCYNCTDTYKCQFVEKIMDIISRKDDKIFKRNPVTPNHLVFNKE